MGFFFQENHREEVPSHHIVLRAHTIYVTYHYWAGLDQLAEVASVRCLHCKVIPFLPLSILYSFKECHYAQPVSFEGKG